MLESKRTKGYITIRYFKKLIDFDRQKENFCQTFIEMRVYPWILLNISMIRRVGENKSEKSRDKDRHIDSQTDR